MRKKKFIRQLKCFFGFHVWGKTIPDYYEKQECKYCKCRAYTERGNTKLNAEAFRYLGF